MQEYIYLKDKTILVTGGLGFIGSAFVRRHLNDNHIVILDLMTYAGDLNRVPDISQGKLDLVLGDIGDENLVNEVLHQYQPDILVHFAAESHVDRSIDGPGIFLKSNVEGTMNLLKCTTTYWDSLVDSKRDRFRFLHVSTDEVYGSLDWHDPPFTESSPYRPNSPYAASKAASDHFVRSWYKTFGLPTITTHCSNNYGSWQFPEKLIPLMISKCLKHQPLPVYGDGKNIRDWIHVDDHISALARVIERAEVGTVWGIGGETEVSNINLVEMICSTLDAILPRANGELYQEQIAFVKDRPGHDSRYAININSIKETLGWSPSITFQAGLTQTVEWYLQHQGWVEQVSAKAGYIGQHRLGVNTPSASSEDLK